MCYYNAGKTVLLIDTDTQAQAGRALGVSPDIGLAEVLENEVPAALLVIEMAMIWGMKGEEKNQPCHPQPVRFDRRRSPYGVISEGVALGPCLRLAFRLLFISRRLSSDFHASPLDGPAGTCCILHQEV